MRKIYLNLIIVYALILGGNISYAQLVQTAKKTTGGTGYLEYLPPDYATNLTRKYPVMFFLHGAGETGTGSATDLQKLKVAGPPKEINNGKNMCFTVNGVEECFIVISPQLGSGVGGWWPGILQGVFDYVMTGPENYRIDKNRVYLTGLSMGGNGVYNGAGGTTDIFAAAGVIAGFNNGYGCTISARKIPMWGFHGESDGTIPYATGLANFQAITSCTTPVPTAEYKWTSYPGVGHNAWDRAYTTDHTYHNPNLYEWLLTKSKSSLPVANAGADKQITLPTNSVTLDGSGTVNGGTITTYSWQKITGGAATLTNASNATAMVSGLVEGIYTFRLTVTDNSGNTATDDVTVTVSPVTTNLPPVITLSASLTLTLPTNSTNITATASDNDGTIVSYLWTQQSGPSTATLTGTTGATLTAAGLIAGTYVFRLTVTDDDAATSFKEISVVVNPAAVNQTPVANAGSDKTVTLPTNTINLTGSGTDADGSVASYLWEKLSGPAVTLTNSTSTTVTLTNLVAGVYSFRLTVTDNLGAKGTDEVQVTVSAANQSPAALAGNDVVLTLPTNSVALGGSGNDPDGWITAYLWSQVTGPSTATLTNANTYVVTVSNLTSGEYTFRLMVTDNSGNTGTDEVKVTVNGTAVNSPPVANAGADKSITLPTSSVTFDGTGTDSDGSIASYSWVKLTGANVTLTNANAASVTVSSLTAGSYSFQLTVTDNKGATASDVVLLTVQPAAVNQVPVADAGADKAITLPANTATLNGSGVDNDGTIASYLWTKQSGPAVTMTGQNTATLQLSVLLEGTYVFRLLVTDDKGATNYDEVTVVVSSINVAPVADAGADIILNAPTNSTIITGSGTDSDGTISAYLWTLVSGPPSSITMTNPTTNTLTVANLVTGSYTFRLKVTDDDGATGTDDVKVIINAANQIPTASAGDDKLITLPANSINITGAGTDNDGTIVSYQWTKTSGPAATLANETNPTVSITVSTSGVYVFRLTVTDNSGDSDFDEVTLTVNEATVNQVPVAYAGENQTLTLPVNSTVISGTGTDLDGMITSYSWTKVSGSSAVLANDNTATLSVSGLMESTYIFRLTVTDDDGASSYAEVTINVLPQAINQVPVAYAGDDQLITLPTNSITLFGSGSDADGTVAGYLWSKISGPAATLANETTATLTLSDLVEGTYIFRLSVIDDQSAESSDDITVTVNAANVNQLPVASAGSDLTISLPTSSVTIEGSGSDADGTIASYLWTKISGPVATMTNTTNPVMTVSGLAEGSYAFRLTVTDNDGATASDDVTLTVLAAAINQSPVVSAGVSVSITLPKNDTQLSGSASDPDGTVVSYAWTKVSGGDATLEDSNKPILKLTGLVEGIYQFRLTATDDKGATGSAQVSVEVKPAGTNSAPVADAGADVSIKLPVNSVVLNGVGTDTDGTIASYLWEKTSGGNAVLSNATTQNLSVSGLVEGNYVFQLTVTDNRGLKATDQVRVTVIPASVNLSPTALAGADVSLTLPQNTVTIQGAGSDPDGAISSYSWQKISGPAATESGNNTPALLLSSLLEGTYTYRLTVTDNMGATGTDDIVITVNPDVTTLFPEESPIAHAGDDQVLQPGTTETKLIAAFEDTGIVNQFSWKQIGGDPVILDGQDQDTVVVKNLSKGSYLFELTVTNLFGKSGSDEVMVTISDEINVNYKKFFSPNGDGENDLWELDPKVEQFSECRVVIFDRKGTRLYTTLAYQNNWNGVYNGEQLPEDAYYFVLECGGKKKSGSITLIR